METQTFRGNVAGDLELRATNSGTPVLKFRLACNDRYRVDGEWKDSETVWINVEAWRRLAENTAESLTKGSAVVVVGRWKANSYETEAGEKRRAQFIVADAIGPDLAYSTVGAVQRTTKATGQAESNDGADEATAHNPFDED